MSEIQEECVLLQDDIDFFQEVLELASTNACSQIKSFKSDIVKLHILIDGCNSTLESIKETIRIKHFADSFTLIRKLKDDLQFVCEIANIHYLYVNNETNININEKVEIYKNWCKSIIRKRKDKKYYIELFSQNHNLDDFMNNSNYYEKISYVSSYLDNYVHSNSFSCIVINVDRFGTDSLNVIYKNTRNCLKEIFIYLISLLFLIYPNIMSSDDYINALEEGIEPEENSQFFIAPLIQDFINKYIKNEFPLIYSCLMNNCFNMKID